MSTTRPSGTPGGVQDPFTGSADATRRGAHRARPTPLMAALPALAVVIVVVLVAFGVYTLLGGAGGGDGSGSTADPLDASPSVSSSASPSSSVQESAAEETPTAEPTQEAEPDKSVAITVLNNTSTRGLAAKGQQKLQNDGWTVPTIGDHKPRGSVPTTTVYYGSEDQKVTAEAVSAAIGAGGVEQNEELAGDGITVVLADDFQP